MAYPDVPTDVAGVPISSCYLPGVGWVSLQASSNTNTDASNNTSAPANMNLAQIGAVAAQMAGSDNNTATNVLLLQHGLYNGTSIDRQRGNVDGLIALASAAVTSNSTSADLTNYNARGVKVYIQTGSFGAGASAITVSIKCKDPVGAVYYTMLTSASLSASTNYVLTVFPGITATSNVSLSDVIPRTWQITWQASAWGTGGSTLAISYAYIV